MMFNREKFDAEAFGSSSEDSEIAPNDYTGIQNNMLMQGAIEEELDPKDAYRTPANTINDMEWTEFHIALK